MNRLLITSVLCLSFILSKELPLQIIDLSGPVTDRKQEISGMDWYKDHLFLLPENQGGYLFMINKSEIQNVLQSEDPEPITPQKTIFNTPDYSILIKGFDGFEAISFSGENVYISIEAEHDGLMIGHIAWGTIDPKTFEIIIPKNNLKRVETPIQLENMSFESIFMYNDNAVMLYEANGSSLQKEVYHTIFSPRDKNTSLIKSINIEYRLTDATQLDINNKFWSINYYWPGDEKLLNPSTDMIFERTIEGKSHQKSKVVERLVEFEVKGNKIEFSKNEPIQLILDKESPRNWEGIVRLNDNGFLLATDKHPSMILAYVSLQ